MRILPVLRPVIIGCADPSFVLPETLTPLSEVTFLPSRKLLYILCFVSFSCVIVSSTTSQLDLRNEKTLLMFCRDIYQEGRKQTATKLDKTRNC